MIFYVYKLFIIQFIGNVFEQTKCVYDDWKCVKIKSVNSTQLFENMMGHEWYTTIDYKLSEKSYSLISYSNIVKVKIYIYRHSYIAVAQTTINSSY